MNVISTKDVQDAVHASDFAYNETGTLVKGAKVPNTNFEVIFTYHDTYSVDGVGFLVFVAVEGSTTIVSYRGTDG